MLLISKPLVVVVAHIYLSVTGQRQTLTIGRSVQFLLQLTTSDSDLFIHTKFKHFTDKYNKKFGDYEKNVLSSWSAAILLNVNNLINTTDTNQICKFGDFSNKNIML